MRLAVLWLKGANFSNHEVPGKGCTGIQFETNGDNSVHRQQFQQGIALASRPRTFEAFVHQTFVDSRHGTETHGDNCENSNSV